LGALFKKAKNPCLIFIDEIDAVGDSGNFGIGGGNDENKPQPATEMDGFEAMLVIIAANRPDVLDSGFIAIGRFDRQVMVDAPDLKGNKS